MNDINFSALLRNLVQAYSDQRISRVEYLTQRRILLDRIDLEFNGAAPDDEQYTADKTCRADDSRAVAQARLGELRHSNSDQQ